MSAHPRLLFVDDEPYLVAPWVQALQEVCDLAYERNASDAITDIDAGHHDHHDLMVFDLMMVPSPDMDTKRTAYGTRTGTLVYDAWRRRLPERPAILFTNTRDDGLFDRLQQRDPNLCCLRKGQTRPAELVAMVLQLGQPR